MRKQEKVTNILISVIIVIFILQYLRLFTTSKINSKKKAYVSHINIIRKTRHKPSVYLVWGYETHNKYKLHAATLCFYIRSQQKFRWWNTLPDTLVCLETTCLFMTINVLFISNDLFLIKIYSMEISLHKSKHE